MKGKDWFSTPDALTSVDYIVEVIELAAYLDETQKNIDLNYWYGIQKKVHKAHKVMKPQTITVTSSKKHCTHANGFYHTVWYKFLWIFDLRKTVFLCHDCLDLINYEEMKSVKQQPKNGQ